jgi:hypothetical protein
MISFSLYFYIKKRNLVNYISVSKPKERNHESYEEYEEKDAEKSPEKRCE